MGDRILILAPGQIEKELGLAPKDRIKDVGARTHKVADPAQADLLQPPGGDRSESRQVPQGQRGQKSRFVTGWHHREAMRLVGLPGDLGHPLADGHSTGDCYLEPTADLPVE